MKHLFLWDGKDVTDGVTFTVPDTGLNELIKRGLFKIPTCTTHDNHKAIDLKIFIIKAQRIVGDVMLIKDRVSIVRAFSQYRYLRWIDDDQDIS